MGAGAGITVDFRNPTVSNGTGTISNIEIVDWVEGSNFDDDITMGTGDGYGGIGTVFGWGGNDRLVADLHLHNVGGDGNDTLDGRSGGFLQKLEGGAGDDTLYTNVSLGGGAAYGGDGNDTIYGHAVIDGGAGDDTIYGLSSAYSLRVSGGTGNDTIYLQRGSNFFTYGNDGNDKIYGSTGNDLIDGGAGDGTIDGGAGGLIWHLSR